MLKLLFKLAAAAFFAAAFLIPLLEKDPKIESSVRADNRVSKRLPTVGVKPNFAAITNVNERKLTFFGFLNSAIAIENHRVSQERLFLLSMKHQESAFRNTASHMKRARKLAKDYHYDIPSEGMTEDWLNSMLLRVNVLPPSLVLTQAANESAWGTSRFATQANNFFGQWCYRKGCGLVPLRRNNDATHEVATFGSVQDSVFAYFMNVNRNRAYRELRTIRSQLEQSGQDLQSEKAALALIQGLSHYSERGQAYVDELQAMIRHNNKYWSEFGIQ
ncbi:glucosaminidase [Vibrio sp. S9_S30]|uniref:glucosaminidase domain-containing protein n=1 Tax=Vibrio sp. S9_S30 TaxID=2720226 RepID=UPI001680F46B|nr:glucosaminidase domain-containing protein [Vibrio sp. S9_S30]MBD1556849.1 glucosaminidase [Vibrio sp. S9_S30]